MRVERISGVEMYEEWSLDNQTILVFGENHTHGGSTEGCKTCEMDDNCYTFLSFLEQLQKTRTINLFVEMSYVNGNVAVKNMPALAVIPNAFKKSNLTELRQKHMRCIWSFAEPPLDMTQTCSLHNVHTYPSDLRLEKVFEETRSTLEYHEFTKALKDLYVFVDEYKMPTIEYNDLPSLRDNFELFRAMFLNPAQMLYDFIMSEKSKRKTESVLAKTFEESGLNKETLMDVLYVMTKHYDDTDATNDMTGLDVRKWLILNLLTKPQTLYDTKTLERMLFLYISSYGTIVTDLFIVLQCLLHRSDNNVILTGTFHSKVYSKVFEKLGGQRKASGESSEYCVQVS